MVHSTDPISAAINAHNHPVMGEVGGIGHGEAKTVPIAPAPSLTADTWKGLFKHMTSLAAILGNPNPSPVFRQAKANLATHVDHHRPTPQVATKGYWANWLAH